MALLLRESDLAGLVTMREVVDAVERCFAEMKPGAFANIPRSRSIVEGGVLSGMHAATQYLGRGGAKVYSSTRGVSEFVFLLFDLRSGHLLSVMGADALGRLRTGAASAVATRHLGRLKSFRLGLAGSGKQALSQVLALKEVAGLERIGVWSPDRAHREKFSQLVSREHGIECTPAESPDGAFRGADVVTTITSARAPFVQAAQLGSVKHMNVCGSNWPDRAEVAPDGIALFDTVCVDDLADSRIESGDLILAAQTGLFRWEDAVELKDVVQSRATTVGPRTLFKSNGLAVEDVALGSLVYDRAVKSGGGAEHFDFTRSETP